MKNLQHLFGVAVVALVTTGMTACGGGGGAGSPAPAPAPTPTPSPPPATTGTLNGLVFSASTGAAINGASASVTGLPAASTNVNGSFQLAGVTASERVVVRVSAPGFVDTLAVAAVRAGSVTLARVILLPIGTSASVNPAGAVSVAASDSPAQLTAAANSFVRADNGAAPGGALTVRLTSIDPAGNPDRMPGDFSTGSGTATQPIESFGAIAVDIRDAQDNRYNLGGGKTATIRIPVSTREASPPASIALFYLDETTGSWIEQGSASLAGSGTTRYYEGTVSHFSYWNADRPYETVYLNGCVQTAAGIRTRNRTVKTDGLDYSGTGYAFSDANGDFRVALRKNSRAVLTVAGGTESVAPSVVGPLAADSTLPGCLVERGNTTILPPSIIAQPASTAVDQGSVATFAVIADGATPLRFQWRRNGVDIPGATGASYTVFATGADNGAVYSVVITNANGTVTSANATLTVNVPNTPPAIVAQPNNVTVQVGQVASFSVTASGAPPLTYQWRRNGTPIAGATGSSYITPATTLADSGSTFDVQVSNNLGTIMSAAVTLTVTTAPPTAGTYKRALAGLIAASYNVGCATGGGTAAGPINVATNGDVSWDSGSMPLSSVQSSVTVGNGYTTFGISSLSGSITDGSIARTFALADTRSPAGSTSSAEIRTTPANASVVRCAPGLTGGFTQPNLVGLVTTWMQGASASLQCSVRVGSTTTTQTLPFTVASGQVTLGTRVWALSAARSADAVSALDVPGQPVDALFAYSAQYADNSNFGLSRSVINTFLLVTYVAANGDNYACSGARQ